MAGWLAGGPRTEDGGQEDEEDGGPRMQDRGQWTKDGGRRDDVVI